VTAGDAGAGGDGAADGARDAATADAAAGDAAAMVPDAGGGADARPVEWKKLALGRRHTCGLTLDARLFCWGEGRAGQLGIGDRQLHARPQPVSGAWLDVAAGEAHTCAVDSGRELWCWGDGSRGQLGAGAATGPERAKVSGPGAGWTAVVAGDRHTCALRGGELWCWGDNGRGQLGIDSAAATVSLPTRVPGIADVTKIAAGAAHTCALRGEALRCWGESAQGRLGLGELSTPMRAVPASPVGGAAARWQAVAAGGATTCALDPTGYRWCWGANDRGQLGCEPFSPCADLAAAWTPEKAGDATAWQSITLGRAHGCAQRATRLSCWGEHEEGQAGRPFTRDGVAPPGDVITPSGGFAFVAAGGDHTCAIGANDQAWCWGSASDGQLGEGTVSNRELPTPLASTAHWRTIAAGWTRHACGPGDRGLMECWGAGDRGQLGNALLEDSAVPTRVAYPGEWSTVGAGLDFTCAKLVGSIRCWGDNDVGQVGSNRSALTPTDLDDGGTDDWSTFAVGRRHACAVRRASAGVGTLWCWGANDQGQASGTAASYARPTQVGAADDWGMVDAGAEHTCGLRKGQLWCWGGGGGEPVRIGTGTGWQQLSVGGIKTCVADVEHTLFCGENQLDPARPVSDLTPVPGSWNSVSAGGDHVCGLMGNAIACFGSNDFGQLGTGDRAPSATPRMITVAASFVGVSAGDGFTCANAASGGFCWGRGHRGQLGNGDAARPLPRPVPAP
jgi:alpha-tubulin suppressor-like RCC1 family protein